MRFSLINVNKLSFSQAFRDAFNTQVPQYQKIPIFYVGYFWKNITFLSQKTLSSSRLAEQHSLSVVEWQVQRKII